MNRRRRATAPPNTTEPQRRAGTDAAPFPRLDALLDPRGPYLVPILLILMSRIVLWTWTPVASEDAYITFRYARNLAGGHGLVYNPGERVMGFSSPLWTVWIALGELLTHQPLLWARATSLIADVATLIAGGALVERYAGRPSAWCFAFFIAAWPYFSAVSASGMENSTYLALILVTATLIDAGSRASGPALAALGLIRPEGIVSAAVLALRARGRDRLIGAALLGAGLLALFLYFGTLVPQSVVAKSTIYGTPGPWAGRLWWEWLSPVILGRWPSLGETVPLMMLAVLLAPAFGVGLVELWRRRDTALAYAALAALTVWAGYALLGVAYFWWYLAVPLGGVALTASLGFPRVVRGRAVAIACILFVLSEWSIARILYIGRAQEEAASFGPAAELLRERARPGEKVLLEPIGRIGYLAPVYVIDEVGLVSPEVAERRLRGAGWYTDLVAGKRPEWLVVRVGVLRTGTSFAGAGAPFRNLAERDRILADYSRVTPEQPSENDRTLVVLRRR